jgi:hypothetical protein
MRSCYCRSFVTVAYFINHAQAKKKKKSYPSYIVIWIIYSLYPIGYYTVTSPEILTRHGKKSFLEKIKETK